MRSTRQHSRASLLTALLTVVLALTGCSPVVQSLVPLAPTPTTPPPRPTVAASNPATPTAPPKPTTAPAVAATKPAAAPSPAAKPASAASPTSSTAASAPAVVATAAASLPAIVASPPAVSAESRGAAPQDALGVANSAGAAAAANASDTEATALCGTGAVLSSRAGMVAGRQATIAIQKVEASYQPSTRGQPTFLNDAPYPNHVFTALIWGENRAQFQPPPESWQGKGLCVTGPVTLFQQRPQIVVTSPSQLRAAR